MILVSVLFQEIKAMYNSFFLSKITRLYILYISSKQIYFNAQMELALPLITKIIAGRLTQFYNSTKYLKGGMR